MIKKKDSNRLRKLFDHRGKKKVFSIFLTLGFTSLSHTEKMMRLAEAEGVDLIELGFPFSDPLADGPVIQNSSQAALDSGIHFRDATRLMKKLRQSGFQIPVLLFSYFNPIFHRGTKQTVRELKESGFDGFLIPDLPPEEGEEFHRLVKSQGLSLIYFLAPTSHSKRIRLVSQKTDEFIYYVSSRGVTGVRKQLDLDLSQKLKRIRRMTRKPVLIGFGISDAEKAKQASRVAEGVIVGSALIRELQKFGPGSGGMKKTAQFLRRLRRSLVNSSS